MSGKELHAPEDTEVIRHILAGASCDFEVLVLRYQDRILSMIMRQVGDEQVARDLAQETFVKAYTKLKSFRRESSFGTWLVRIALNHTSNYLSSRQYREKKLQIEFDHERHPLPEGAEAERIEKEARIEAVRAAVSSLKEKFRDVLVLCAYEGMSYEQAAGVLEIPYGTVCSRMNSALTQLREKLKGF